MLKANSPLEKLAVEICDALAKHLDEGKPARTFSVPDHADAGAIVREMHLLTAKPTFYIANVDEASLGKLEGNPHYQALAKRARRPRARPSSRSAPRSRRRSPSSNPPTDPSFSRARA